MLSYRHSFHCGNGGDVLKHLVLLAVIDYYKQRGKPYTYIDSHAGAGFYALNSKQAQKKQEFMQGIGRLWEAQNTPPLLRQYLQLVDSYCGRDHYFGSPFLAGLMAGPEERLRLFELHPADYPQLRQAMGTLNLRRRCQINHSDGLKGLTALLPPTPRRAVVLIDPAYEDKGEYYEVAAALEEALRRFASGCYLLWYPCLARLEQQQLVRKLSHRYNTNFLRAELHWRTPPADGFGMFGAGVYVINPPFGLAQQLNPVLDYLKTALAQDGGAKKLLQFKSP